MLHIIDTKAIGRWNQNPFLMARRAVEMGSGTSQPLQNEIGQILAPPKNQVIQQPR